MKKPWFGMLLLAVSAALVPAFASGGEKPVAGQNEVKVGPPPYSISPPRTRMSGSVMAARNSADDKQYIGCVHGASAGTWGIGYCYARTATGNPIMCSTSDAGLIAAMGSISAASFVAVDYENNTGNCVKIEIHNNSRHITHIVDAYKSPATGTINPGTLSP
jgi:hypothetical protein